MFFFEFVVIANVLNKTCWLSFENKEYFVDFIIPKGCNQNQSVDKRRLVLFGGLFKLILIEPKKKGEQ